MSEETGKVLLIGDAFVHDVSLAESFKKSGFTSEVVPFDVAALKGFDFNCYSAVIVDSKEVSEDPVKYLKELFYGCFVPLMVLSEDDDVINHVLALEMGADDFVVKPVDGRVLVARVKSIIRRGRKGGIPAKESVVPIAITASCIFSIAAFVASMISSLPKWVLVNKEK